GEAADRGPGGRGKLRVIERPTGRTQARTWQPVRGRHRTARTPSPGNALDWGPGRAETAASRDPPHPRATPGRPAALPTVPPLRRYRMRAPLWLSVLAVAAAAGADDPKAPDPLPADLVREWEKVKAVSGWMDTAHPFLRMERRREDLGKATAVV